MYTIVNRTDKRVTIKFQHHTYTDVYVDNNEDQCIKLFLRKKLFGKLDLGNDLLEISHLIKENSNSEYCFIDLINKFTLQEQLKKHNFQFIKSCLPTNEDTIIKFVTNGQYIVRPCIDSSLKLPYFNKIYDSATDIITDLEKNHRWKDLQQSISFRERHTAHRYSKFIIQEYFPYTYNRFKNTEKNPIIELFLKTFSVSNCEMTISIKNDVYIDNVQIHNLYS